MWIIISIVLAITCMWLIKVNKDLVERNYRLIKDNLVKEINVIKLDQEERPITEEEVEKLKKVLQDKED